MPADPDPSRRPYRLLVTGRADVSGSGEPALALVEQARRRHALKVSRVVAGTCAPYGEAVAA
jgi:hypothetical protein